MYGAFKSTPIQSDLIKYAKEFSKRKSPDLSTVEMEIEHTPDGKEKSLYDRKQQDLESPWRLDTSPRRCCCHNILACHRRPGCHSTGQKRVEKLYHERRRR